MSVALDSGKVFNLARKIAADAAAKYGREDWAVEDCHINLARQQLATETGAPLKKVIAAPTAKDEELLRKANAAQFQRRDPHATGLAGPPHQRIEIGEVETREHGRLRVAHDRADGGTLIVHDIAILMEELDRDLRDAIVDTSATFSLAASAESQTSQRVILGTILSEVLARPSHRWFADKVKERTDRLRFTAV